MDWAVWEQHAADDYAYSAEAYAAQGDLEHAAQYAESAAEHQEMADYHGDLGEHGGDEALTSIKQQGGIMLEGMTAKYSVAKSRALKHKGSDYDCNDRTAHDEMRRITTYSGPCRYCSCPGFAGDGMHCARSYCGHHWNDHDL